MTEQHCLKANEGADASRRNEFSPAFQGREYKHGVSFASRQRRDEFASNWPFFTASLRDAKIL